jgi:carboxylate-amine ligase
MARSLVEELRSVSQDLGCENELLDILEIVENGTGSQHQRRVYEKSGDFLDVVAFLIENTRPAMAETPGEE